ncbi:MAG: hypothetical protein HY289_01195 [Planctomycetes bacterium]|nr:hypothetical protein [Planctomycetota bacterium]
MHGRIILGMFCTLLLSGCSEAPAPAPLDDARETALAGSFDRAATGVIRGRVTWDGDVPASHEMVVRENAFNPRLHLNPARYLTPHVPTVHPQDRGVENAVVFLRVVDPHRSKAWDYPKARVVFNERRLTIEQGPHVSSVGFIRCGSAIDIVNRDSEFHLLRARGGAFFAMPLIEPNRNHERRLTQAGIVDLTCGAGYYWLHAHLFVVEHPYYTRTDPSGAFSLTGVPDGTYELVCWLPSWHVERKEYDPETAIIARWAWASPKEQTRAVEVKTLGTCEMTFQWKLADFAPH